jgi:hypothetical protein
MKDEQKCGATCPNPSGGEDSVCGRSAGHSGKHLCREGRWHAWSPLSAELLAKAGKVSKQ